MYKIYSNFASEYILSEATAAFVVSRISYSTDMNEAKWLPAHASHNGGVGFGSYNIRSWVVAKP